MSGAALGRRLGIDPSSMNLTMHGKRRWYFDEVVTVAEILNTSVAYLIGEVDDDKPLKTRKTAADESATASGVAREGLDPSTSRL